jgi:nitrite reductase (NADH) small subunit
MDPFSGASVLSRGIVGDREGRPTVASPIYKQVFELATGICLDDPSVSVPTYPARVSNGVVEVCSS